jgi:hypothetical protein
MDLLLGSNLTAHQVYKLVVPALLEAGMEDTCSGLIDFLTVALVAPSVAVSAPLTVHKQVGLADYTHGPGAISHRCESVLYHDLAAIRQDTLALDVPRGVQYMVVEARAERDDHNDVRAEAQYESSESWTDFVSKCRYPCGDLQPDVKHLPHGAASFLDRLR